MDISQSKKNCQQVCMLAFISSGGVCVVPSSLLIYMQYYTSYQLISVTVIVFKSVHKITIGTYIGLCLTHVD